MTGDGRVDPFAEGKVHMLKIDIGCGAAKRPGFIGVDVMGEPDVVCDISSERLPFDDLSADFIFSAHCLEHIVHSSLGHVFKEITRIAANDALIEIWHPHASHSDAFVLDHVNYLSEALYAGLRRYWSDYLGAQWVLQEIRYGIEPHVLEDIENARMGIDFAVCYLREIIKEIGIFARIDRTGSTRLENYSRFVYRCYDREHMITQLSDGPRLTALTHQTHGPPNGDDGVLDFAHAMEKVKTENEILRAECSNLQSIVAQTISERDTLATTATRWFDAVIAVTPDHNPLARKSPTRHSWWRSLARRLYGDYSGPWPIALADRARDAGKWELAVRYYRDALDVEPDEPEIWVQFGHALKQAGKTSEAELAYQRSREYPKKGPKYAR